jgi:hypothetical protein
LTHRVSVECPTFGTLLIALYRHDTNTPAQDRTRLGVTELVKGAVVVDRRVDARSGLSLLSENSAALRAAKEFKRRRIAASENSAALRAAKEFKQVAQPFLL